ncbi:hypothetical protein L9F63_008626, partial [Diploptera punctata]
TSSDLFPNMWLEILHSENVWEVIDMEKHGSNRMAERLAPRLLLMNQQTLPAGSNAVDISFRTNMPDENNGSGFIAENSGQSHSDVNRLKSTATLSEILEAMKNTTSGVGFLTYYNSLPSFTFVSADAIQWIISHVDDVLDEEKALQLMEKMLKEQMICHASGDFNHPFIIGFYLYHIVQHEKDQKDGEYSQPLGDLQSFENEWLEVEVKHPTAWRQSTPATPTSEQPATVTKVPKFLCTDLEEICQEACESERDWQVPLYKHTHLDIDVNGKSDRVEWGHARYQSVYKPDTAFELVVQWVCSSGTIVTELIMGWSRKAQTCGLQMIPIPSDPLALPFTHKSDPLRGPIFIPLDTECLMGNKSYLFEEFPEKTWDQRLFLFQETIVERFGFMRCKVENLNVSSPTANQNTSNSLAHTHQYVHLTGNMFILIPSQPCHRPHHRNAMSSPHEEYITRHVSGKNKNDYDTDRRRFIGQSSYLLYIRRWKSSTSATGDEMFQTKILKDFREFCANNDNRLKQFWDSCWILKEPSSFTK